jgi:murein DD-endopeptidase MepM/ murein hydrolase activator NlpD
MKYHNSRRSNAAIGAIATATVFGALVAGVNGASQASEEAPVSAGTFGSGFFAQAEASSAADVLPNGMVVPMKNFEISAPYRDSTGVHAGRSHAGIDLAGPSGKRVISATSGEVVHAGPEGGYGNLVKVKTPAGQTVFYAHLSKITVKKGDTVTAGQKIGREGSTGNSTGPHLHFEIQNPKGKPMNPLRFLGVTQQQLADLGN